MGVAVPGQADEHCDENSPQYDPSESDCEQESRKVYSGDFQKGLDAYNNSDYVTALRELEPLAELGFETDYKICMDAVMWTRTGRTVWSTYFPKHKTEAIRRGLSPSTCRQISKWDPPAPAGPTDTARHQ